MKQFRDTNLYVNENGETFTANGRQRNPYIRKDGYTSLNVKGVKTVVLLHRIIAEVYIPNPENKPEVNHKDGNKLNNSVDNLEWVTHKENMKHAYNNELISQKGENSVKSKLTEKDVRFIRKSNLKQRELAKMFNVNQTNISCIKRRKSWSHITNL